MFHLLAYQRTAAGAETNANMTGITDGYATLQSSGAYLLPKPMMIKAAFLTGVALTNGRINAPSLREVAVPSISPVNVALLPGDLPAIQIYPPSHLELQAGEEVLMQDTVTGASQLTGGLFVGDMQTDIPQGQLYTCRMTTGVTTVARAWNQLVLAPETSLPAGGYECVGLRVTGTNFILARLNFMGGGPKPGCICGDTAAQDSWNYFRNGQFGRFGKFTNVSLPLLEVYPDAAGGSAEAFLDIIKVF